MQTVLVIDDNEGIRTALDVLLSLQNIETMMADSPESGLDLIRAGEVDVVIQDMNFSRDTTSGEEGIELFREIRRIDSELPVILLTAWTHLEQAVELVKEGAADYLEKPWDDAKLVTTIRNLLRLRQLSNEKRRLEDAKTKERKELAEEFDTCGLIYRSDVMHRVVLMATQVAHADVPVLITGPNGSGKEKLAEIVQANSACADGPFIRVNVGALPSELLESELFGAEPGAYTGATKARKGRFEAADGGTLFLDEIGNLPLSGQVKLLRVLQTGEFERLGSTETRKTNARIISATNANLLDAVRDGSFREDLLYRLNVIELRVPLLSDRKDDILPVAEHFLQAGVVLSDEAKDALLAHTWPGNVRELQNCIQRATLMAQDGVIELANLGLERSEPVLNYSIPREPTKQEVIRALADANGVVARAARSLGLSRQALYRRMEKFQIGK